MEVKEILSHVDHTQLKAYAAWEDIKKLCDEAIRFGTASVCVPPCYIKRIHETYPELNICTVVGFPLGYSVTAAKVVETEQAIADGANEVDMVINISDVKNGDYDAVAAEIRALRKAAGPDHILKVIIETCYLTDEEKTKLCHIVTEEKADYIKTSTGFGTAGAQLSDIELFKREIGPEVKMKAAGGIRKKEDMEAFLAAGCERIGCSSAAGIAEESW